MIVAVPFLWRPLPWKRLLAYSSLEHMGVIALGIGFGTPLAIAGVLLHVAGHALAKALGFYAALPLLRADPDDRDAAAPPGVASAADRDRDGRQPGRARRPAAVAAVRLGAADRCSAASQAGEAVVAAVAVGRARARLPRPAARADRGRHRRAGARGTAPSRRSERRVVALDRARSAAACWR